jgi:hypothetical protein
MYAAFTDRAKRAFQLANQEAQQLLHSYIGTEHILLGLLKEGTGVAAHVLQDLTLDSNAIARQVKTAIRSQTNPASTGNIPDSRHPKKVIEYAMEESRKSGHGYVGTEHILLGLLREREGVAGMVLTNLGLDVEGVRAQIASVLDRPYDWKRTPCPAWSFTRSVEERHGPVVEPPKACPKCGQARVVRVLWHWVHLSGKNEKEVAAGTAILASRSYGQGPPWVCLQCEPKWSEVHDLALQDHEREVAKMKAVTSQDFDQAAKHRDAQMELLGRLHLLIEELLRNR